MQFGEQDVIIAAGASALVALLRKKWPKIDGGWVWLAMFLATALLYGAFEFLPMLHPSTAKVVGAALAVIAIVTGGKGVLAQLAGAAQQRLGGGGPAALSPVIPPPGSPPRVDARVDVLIDGAPIAPGGAPPADATPAPVTSAPPGAPAPQLDFNDAARPR